MADTITITGSRDDLVVEASRCLKMRFSESSCRRCVDICPHRAVSLDGFIAVNQDHCSGCLLCTAVCPAGALEQNGDFSNIFAQLTRVSDPVLGCLRTKEHSNAILTCLGGLSDEHLVTLCHSLSGKLILNLSLCSGCSNSTIITHLLQRLEVLFEAGLLEGGCDIVTAEYEHEINYHDESVDRRSFFKSFGNSLFKSAAVILSSNSEQTERRSEYAAKRLPVKRELLNRIRNKLPPEFEARLHKYFDSCLSFSDSCTRCQGCVAICPTGALQAGQSDDTPTYSQRLCTGCGLCREFCLDGAVQLSGLK